jgi:spore coat protein JA
VGGFFCHKSTTKENRAFYLNLLCCHSTPPFALTEKISYFSQAVIHILGRRIQREETVIVNEQNRYYEPYVSPLDPCPPRRVKTYITPPNLFIPFQPPNLQQFNPYEALKHGTLWPALYSPYGNQKKFRQEEGD